MTTAPMPPVRPVIDHMSITTNDLARAVRFYDAVLQPLGLVRVADYDEEEGASSCWGPPGTLPAPEGHPGAAPFWVQYRPDAFTPPPGTHVCFCAADEAAVHAFHAAGLAAGGTDYGAPGLRPHYGPGYYAAFLTDPDGWRIEAVTYKTA